MLVLMLFAKCFLTRVDVRTSKYEIDTGTQLGSCLYAHYTIEHLMYGARAIDTRKTFQEKKTR